MVINFIEVGEIKFLSCIFVVNIGNQLEFTSLVSKKKKKKVYVMITEVIFLIPLIKKL
jgi:hypothetical protein